MWLTDFYYIYSEDLHYFVFVVSIELTAYMHFSHSFDKLFHLYLMNLLIISIRVGTQYCNISFLQICE